MATAELNLTEKLVLTHASKLDFSKAHQLADQVSDIHERAFTHLAVADAYGQSGLETAPIFNEVMVLGEAISKEIPSNLYYSTARIFASLGDIPKALEAASYNQFSGFFYIWMNLDIAVAQKKAGLNFRDSLQQADNHASMSEDANLYSYLAKGYYDLGLDAAPTLTVALRNAERRQWHFAPVAEAFAYCGLFNQAFRVADMIKKYENASSEDRDETLANIARRKLEKGIGWPDCAWGVDFKDDLLMIELMAKNARLNHQMGKDPAKFLNAAHGFAFCMREEPEAKDVVKGRQHSALLKDAVWAYSYIGKYEAECDLDPRDSLTQAFQKACKINDPEAKADSFIAIAHSQSVAGRDALPALQFAMVCAGKIAENPQKGDMFAGIKHIVFRQEIAELAAQLGYFDYAKNLAEGFDGEDIDPKARVWATIAKEEAKRGLSTKELVDLSGEDLRAVLQGDNEAAKAALTYFGFAG